MISCPRGRIKLTWSKINLIQSYVLRQKVSAAPFLQIRNPRNTDILNCFPVCYDSVLKTYTNKMHSIIQNQNNVLLLQLLSVSGFNGPSSGGAQLYKRIV